MINLYYILFFSCIFIPFKFQPAESQNLSSFFHGGNCECERDSEFAPRIVGGEIAELHAYPWMAGIFTNNMLFCGGSLINDRYILTAGHCFLGTTAKLITVILGLHDKALFEKFKRGGEAMEVEKIIVHEDFSSISYHDSQDIALAKLKNPVTFSETIRPICLPENSELDYSGETALITGWGKMSAGGQRSELLRQANVTIISNEECKKNEHVGEYILDTMLCAYKDNIDACQGDSGGPLFRDSKTGRMEQVGIVSWGIGCAEPGIPGVYTRVSSYLDWIASHTKDATYCKSTS